jgi:hypothetical protein
MSLKYWLSGIGVLVICGSLDQPLPAQSGAPAAQRPGALPTFKLDPSWPPKLPNDWVMGQMSGVAVDQHDNVWLIHRPRLIPNDKRAHAAPPVLEFDANGKFLQGWGGPGTGYEWPENEHGIYVDDKDVVWISGQAGTGSGVVKFKMLGGQKVPVDDDMLLKFTTKGRFLQQIGHQNQSGGNKDTKNLKEPAEFLLYRKTNELFVADGYGNSRIIVLDPETGAFKRMWGAFGKTPADAPPAPLRPGYSGLAEPEPPPPARGAPPAARAGGAPAGGTGPAPKTAPGPDQFGDPLHSVKVSNDELVYAADRTYGRVQVFTLQGTYNAQLFTGGSPGGLALSPDAQQQFLYVGDGARILVVDRKTMQILSAEQFGPRGSVSTHLIAIDSKGNIYTTELDRGTHKFLFTGMSAAAAR